ncbi:unnamed protein product [Caenorhabditis nigoni]
MKKEIDYMFAALKFEGAGAKFYTLEHGLVEMDVVEDPPKLGQLYDLFEDMKNYAITPNVFQLPTDMAKRFRYRVWSPFLKYLNDPEDKSEE